MLLETVDVDADHGRADALIHVAKFQRRIQPVEEKFAVGQAGQIVVHGVVQQPLLRGALLGDIDKRADDAQDFAVGADDRPRLHAEPVIMAVGAAQAEILIDAAAALFEHGVERRTDSGRARRDACRSSQLGGRSLELAAAQAELRFDFGADENAVGRHVPIEDDVAGAGERQRLALDVGHRAMRETAAGKGVLHDGEADQHDDQHEAADQRRRDEIVGQRAGDGESRPRTSRRAAGTRSGSASRRGHSHASQIEDEQEADARRSVASEMRATPAATAGS